MKIKLSSIKSVFIQYESSYMENSVTLWMNANKLAKKFGGTAKSWTKKQVQKKFSYGIQNTPCFSSVIFDQKKKKTLLADRYGGDGVGTNGGGGRIGIIGNFQIKGVGRNPLVGKSDQEWHSYGGQSLIDAVLEAINSEVFGHILPIGTVTCYGVIYTGPDTAYMPADNWGNEKGPGALLIRDLCVRPAHFFRAAHFKVRDEYTGKLLGDVKRTRSVNKELYGNLKSHKHLISFLGEFLSNCANQFAFARIFRIHHGVLSPSNISFDGRWLDLTNISFVDSGKNYASDIRVTPFYDESGVILLFLKEFIYTYTKYNQIEFDIKSLVNYYHEQLSAYTVHYTSLLFGLSPDVIGSFKSSASYLKLVNAVSEINLSNRKIVVGSPTGINPDDPILLFLEDLFCSFSCKPLSENDLHRAFQDMFLHAYQTAHSRCSFSSFVTTAAISAFKKACFSSFFTRGRIIGRLIKLVKGEELEFFEDYIESHTAVAKWLFEDEGNNRNILFKSSELEIHYLAEEGTYIAHFIDSDERFSSVNQLRVWIGKQDDKVFMIDNYHFKTNLLRMTELLRKLESLKELNFKERSPAYV